ncbi:MAG: hypothetical protein ACRCT1_20045 [Microcoleaceae cyanobacterium]
MAISKTICHDRAPQNPNRNTAIAHRARQQYHDRAPCHPEGNSAIGYLSQQHYI